MFRRTALLLTLLLAAGALTVPAAAAAGTLTFTAAADTYVSSADPTTPKGAQLNMRANGSSPEQISYVKFTVSGVPDNAPVPPSATLKITGGSVTQPAQTVTVWTVGNTWDENTIYTTRPALGTQVASGTMDDNLAMTVAVPVAGNGTVSFAVKGGGTASAIMQTRENTTPPVLTVNYGDQAPPPLPAGDWALNCHTQPYGYAQTTSPNGVISRRFEVRQGDQASGDLHYGDGRQRCEEKLRDVFFDWDTDVWMAYDFRWSGAVPSAAGGKHEIMNQFQQAPEACDTVGHPPSLSLRYEGGEFRIGSHATTSACDTVQPPNVNIYAQPWFPANTWQRIVLRVKFNPTGSGSVTLWVNGVQKYNNNAVALGYAMSGTDPANLPHFSHGIYRDGTPETTVFEFANLQVGYDSLAGRVSNPPPLPN